MKKNKLKRSIVPVASAGVVGAVVLLAAQVPAFAQAPFNNLFPQETNSQGPSITASNGDNNPYSLAVVPFSSGNLVAGDVLVADFNNSSGTQGAGTSIVEVNPTTGKTSTFFQSSAMTGPVGIAINQANDIVWVTYYGSTANGSGGGFMVIKPNGTMLANFNNSNSSTSTNNQLWEAPWGAAFAKGAFFWSNAGTTKSGQGEVWRLNPNPTGTSNGQPLNSTYQLLAELPEGNYGTTGPTPSTVAGPQGEVYDPANGYLYVADDANNTIYAIPNALTAQSPETPIVVSNSPLLQSPQNIAINPVNGMLLVVNGATNNDLVEINPANGAVIGVRSLDPTPGGGALFGLATAQSANGQTQIYYDDSVSNTLNVLSGNNGLVLAQANGLTTAFGPNGVPSPSVHSNIVGIAPAGGNGYWEVTANGMVYAFDGATNYGNVANLHLAAPIVGIASTPDGGGYWLVGADGGVFAFGDATFMGNTYTDNITGLTGPRPLAAPIIAIVPTADGGGYWLVGADGGVFSFGDATFPGSAAGSGITFKAAGPTLSF
jgi:hypothetical protein